MTRPLSTSEFSRGLRAAHEALAEAWLFPEGLAVAARKVAALMPGYAGAIYFREPNGCFSEIGHDTPGRLALDWREWPNPLTLETLQPWIRYQLRGADPNAGAVHDIGVAVSTR